MPGAIVCARGRRQRRLCSICGDHEHELLCDGRDPGATSTCDAPMCRRCALHAPGDKDYCPGHAHQARLQRNFQFVEGRR